MGSVGDAYDNALCESFSATLECELLDRRRLATPADARLAVFDLLAYPSWRCRFPERLRRHEERESGRRFSVQ